MTDDILISESPVRDRSLSVPPADVTRWMADEYERPSVERMRGGHGESLPLPLPAVSGGSGEPPVPPDPPTAVTPPEPDPRPGLMPPTQVMVAEYARSVSGRVLVHQVVLNAAMRTAEPPPAPVNGPSTADISKTFAKLHEENARLNRLLGPAPQKPTPYTPAPMRQRTPPPRPLPLERDLVAFAGWTMAVVLIIWAAVLTSITVWVY